MRGQTHPLLVVVKIIIRNSIGFGDDRNQVDLLVELLHDLNVKGLQRVASGLDEVDNSMDAVVHNVHTVDLVLSVEVSVKSLLNVLNNGVPRFIVVDEVTEARRVDNSQSEADTVLLDISAD